MPARLDSELFTENPENGCWEFTGSRTHNGYGQMKRKGKHIRAHRYFYEKYNSPIGENMVLDHICNNAICVKPSHLTQSTIANNTRRGLSAKLSLLEVEEIKNSNLSQSQLASQFRVSQSQISRIKSGLRWVL